MSKQPPCTCGACRRCKASERSRQWRKDNPNRHREYHKKYRREHLSEFATYSREWDARNPEKRRAVNEAWRRSPPGQVSNRATARRAFDRKREWLDAFKRGPCADCGKKYPPYVYDFDHVRGEKKFALAEWMNYKVKATEEEVLAEIAKCELRCANCHRIRHATQLV